MFLCIVHLFELTRCLYLKGETARLRGTNQDRFRLNPTQTQVSPQHRLCPKTINAEFPKQFSYSKLENKSGADRLFSAAKFAWFHAMQTKINSFYCVSNYVLGVPKCLRVCCYIICCNLFQDQGSRGGKDCGSRIEPVEGCISCNLLSPWTIL